MRITQRDVECGGGMRGCVSPTRWYTRIGRIPHTALLRSFRVGLLKYRVFDTRRGVGQSMSMDITRRDGWPLRMSPRAVGTKPQ